MTHFLPLLTAAILILASAAIGLAVVAVAGDG